MATVREMHAPAPPDVNVQQRAPIWLSLSLPIAFLAIAGSTLGILFEDSIYSKETANWAAQSVGQDIANLIAFPALLVFAMAARRGSLRAYLGWLGLLVYSAYTYTIYAFDAHFGPLFLLWVAVFGLSVYALIGGTAALDPALVKRRFTAAVPIRLTSRLLIGIGLVFYLLWLSEIVPPMVAGTTPEAVREAGLFTNPVHVLDLALFLPAAVAAGVLLARWQPWGFVLAPVVLVAMVFLGVGIASLMIITAARGLDSAPGVGVAITALAVFESLVVIRFLGAVNPPALHGVLRIPYTQRESDRRAAVAPFVSTREGVGS